MGLNSPGKGPWEGNGERNGEGSTGNLRGMEYHGCGGYGKEMRGGGFDGGKNTG